MRAFFDGCSVIELDGQNLRKAASSFCHSHRFPSAAEKPRAACRSQNGDIFTQTAVDLYYRNGVALFRRGVKQPRLCILSALRFAACLLPAFAADEAASPTNAPAFASLPNAGHFTLVTSCHFRANCVSTSLT